MIQALSHAAEMGRVKIKTLLVVPWEEERGGVLSVIENLTKSLQAQGHEVVFFHPGRTVLMESGLTKLGFPGVRLRLNMPFGPNPNRVLRALAFPFLFAASMLQLIWFIRKQHIQIVNLHYPGDSFFYFAICRFLLPIRLVTSLHGGDVFYKAKPKEKYSRAFRFVLHSSDLIILPSDSYREKLLEAFPGVRGKTIFIHNGFDPAQFSFEENGENGNGVNRNGVNRNGVNRDGENRYILCVADHKDYKGIDVLLNASRSLLTNDRSLRLVLAGDGPLRTELEDLASSLGIRNQTQFLGSKGVAEIQELLRGCEVLVLASREESFGIAIIEAMACKKPVVATAVGGIPEIIEHEKSGILVEPDNPEALAEGLRRVLTNSELKTTLAENGYSRVMERFRFTHTGAAYETAFFSLLGLQKVSPHSPSETSATGGLDQASVQMSTLLVVPWDMERGGVMSVLENLARYFLARGHEVLFFHPDRNILLKNRLTRLGFPGVQLRLNMPFGPRRRWVLRTLAFPFLFTASMLQLGWLIRKRHIQIVNLHYPSDDFSYFATCRYLLPIRLITTVHGNDAFDDLGRPKETYSRAFRFMLSSSDLIVLPSDTYRKRLLAVFPGLKDKTISIHNGVNPAQLISPENGQDREGKRPYILCVADHKPYKAIDILLHALKLLLASDRSIRLVLAGDGPLREELEGLALSLGIHESVQFLGAQGAKEVARLLHGCEIFVLPSRADNCPIAIIEAMVCKKPIVAAAVGGIPELIEHEKSGILVEPENPEALAEGLRRVLGNSKLKKTLAGNAYSRAMDRFCFTHTGAAYETAFAGLLGLQTTECGSALKVVSVTPSKELPR